MSHPSLDEARSLFRDRLIAPGDIAAAFGDVAAAGPSLPFRQDELVAAARAGEVLIYRTASGGGEPVTIRSLIQRFPQAFDAKLLQASGYQLKNEWGIELEPLAASDSPAEGWALFQPQVLPTSVNRSYPEQDAALRSYEECLSLRPGTVRRRTAIEAVYDTVMCFVVRNQRLLESTWDWTSTMTVDRGLLHIGGFGSRGMQILGFSPGIRHGGLGVCPTRQPQ
ncbi:MAG TPA: hypothetical protein VEB21_20095 [Terriglobales bacterium]|nr:hypothetical protein [Terriglobales bacterium]